MKEAYRCAACRIPFNTSEAASLHYIQNHYSAAKTQGADQVFMKRPRLEESKLDAALPTNVRPMLSPQAAWKPLPVRRPAKPALAPALPSSPMDYQYMMPEQYAEPVKRKIHLHDSPVSRGMPESPLLPPRKCFQCNSCPNTFSTIDEAALHMMQLHCDSASVCPFCQASAADFNGLRIHVEFSHRDQLKAWGGLSRTQGCIWCQSQARHSTYCMVRRGTKERVDTY